MQTALNGITVNIIHKNVKNINLRLKSGQIFISLPIRAHTDDAINFAKSKMPWIMKNINNAQCNSGDFSIDNGIKLFGQTIIPTVKTAESISLILMNSEIILNLPHNADISQINEILVKFYKKALQKELSHRLPFYENLLNLYSSSYYIRPMKTKWGTCNIATGRLCFNAYLAKFPYQCLDYLIIHELSHLKFPLHDKQFYEFVKRYCPDYKSIQNILNSKVCQK